MDTAIKSTVLGGLIATLVSAQSAISQELPIEVLPQEIRDSVNSSLSNAINGIHVFSASDSVSSGFFKFDEDDGPDTDMDVQKINVEYDLEPQADGAVVPFISALIGNVKIVGELPPESEGANDFLTFSTTSFGAGAGLKISLPENFEVSPKLMVVYSRTRNNYDYNNEFSSTILSLFDGDLFNWDVDTLSVIPSLRLATELQTESLTVTPSIQYAHVRVESIWTNSELLDVQTSSDVLKVKLEAGLPINGTDADLPAALRIYAARSDIFGDARRGFELEDYYEAGFLVSVETGGSVPLFTEIGLGGSYIWNSDFDGFRIGLEGEL